jgi:hypothetical protein
MADLGRAAIIEISEGCGLVEIGLKTKGKLVNRHSA